MIIHSFTLVFILLASCYAYKLHAPETCPDSNETHPCHCENVEDTGMISVFCHEEMYNHQLEQILKSLKGKNDVEMSFEDINLDRIPSRTFEGIGIVKLEFSRCEVESITDDDGTPALSGLEDTLEELLIRSSISEIHDIKRLTLGHLHKLKGLTLSSNEISEIAGQLFENGPSSLEYLYIYQNHLQRMDDAAFSALSNLKILLIEDNRFGNIKRSMLPTSAEKLESLQLENNGFTSLPEDIFSGMPSLTSVSLKDNGILRLDHKTWEPVWGQLYVIELEDNPIECDAHMTWMFSLKTTTAIYGTCGAPKEIKGKNLQNFIDDKGQ